MKHKHKIVITLDVICGSDWQSKYFGCDFLPLVCEAIKKSHESLHKENRLDITIKDCTENKNIGG